MTARPGSAPAGTLFLLPLTDDDTIAQEGQGLCKSGQERAGRLAPNFVLMCREGRQNSSWPVPQLFIPTVLACPHQPHQHPPVFPNNLLPTILGEGMHFKSLSPVPCSSLQFLTLPVLK